MMKKSLEHVITYVLSQSRNFIEDLRIIASHQKSPSFVLILRHSMLFKIIFNYHYSIYALHQATSLLHFLLLKTYVFLFIYIRATHLVHLILCPSDHPKCLLESIFYQLQTFVENYVIYHISLHRKTVYLLIRSNGPLLFN